MSSATNNLELKIGKELATTASAAAEWHAYPAVIDHIISDTSLLTAFKKMQSLLNPCFLVPINALAPLLEIDTKEKFEQEFDSAQAAYQGSFLDICSRPRVIADNTHLAFLEICQHKLYKSSYPILKRTFNRLYLFMDKWVTNDAWMIMSIDVIIKTFNQLLLEIKSLKTQDVDEAWLVFSAACKQFRYQTQLISTICAKDK